MKRFLILFVVIAYSVVGCAGSTKRMKPDFHTYLKWRADDFAEIVDIGFTISKKPYFALYADELSLLPVGYAHVDGYFVGWGGGQLGMTTHAVHSWGLLAHGKEELGWHRQYEGEGGVKEAKAKEAWRNREGFID